MEDSANPRQAPLELGALMRSSARQAPATSGLLLLNVVVFVVMLVFGSGLWHTSQSAQLAWGANFGPATQDRQWWRLVTAMFVHFGLVHLAVNLWALWDVGRLVERLYGTSRWLLLYLGAGVFGNFLSLVVQGNQAVSAGASGAIFGLYGALMVFLWRERGHVDRSEFRWMFAAAATFTLLMLMIGQLLPGIDNSAHVGGLLAGALWGVILARPWTVHSPAFRAPRWFSAFCLSVAVGTLVLNIPAPSYRFTEEEQARKAIQNFLSNEQEIGRRWFVMSQSLRPSGMSFEQIAGSVDSDIAAAYEYSFEEMSAVRPTSGIPSGKMLLNLKNYATVRADVAHELADALRARDTAKIQVAMERAKQASVRFIASNPAAFECAKDDCAKR